MENYLMFVAVAVAAAIFPGADFAVVVKNTLAYGRLGGQATGIGIGAGLFAHTAAVVLGLSAIIAQSVVLFELIKYAGAAYLLYLGFSSWRAGDSNLPGMDEAAANENVGVLACFRQGALTNLLNPKAVIFYLTLLPQFVNPGSDPYQQLILLGLTGVVIVAGWFVFLAYALDRIKAWLDRPHQRLILRKGTALMLLLCGIKLFFERGI